MSALPEKSEKEGKSFLTLSVVFCTQPQTRPIRPFAIGRKNWLFMGSPDGANAAANLYSLIETAKLNDVNPEGYLKFVLENTIDANDTHQLEALMPWNITLENGYVKPSLKPKDANLEKHKPQETTIKDTR
jgi:hypothetical protein